MTRKFTGGRVTQVEIAEACSLDVSTVNKILNAKRGPVFHKSTIQRVFQIAKEMGYRLPDTSKYRLIGILEEIFPSDVDLETLSKRRSLPPKYIEEVQRLIARA
jgi:transcriptional regulator with XRE-family HTH domain